MGSFKIILRLGGQILILVAAKLQQVHFHLKLFIFILNLFVFVLKTFLFFRKPDISLEGGILDDHHIR